jgi:hypothetical protein
MRVNFKHPTSNKDRKKQRKAELRAKAAEQKESGFDINMGEDGDDNSKLQNLSKAKQKQIFKKGKGRDIKAQIA